MKANTCYSGLILFLIFLLVHTVSCLKCYECFSSVSGNCGHEFQPNKIPPKSCNVLDVICYKETKTVRGIPVVKRDCGTPKTCNTMISNCFACNTELCNGSSTTFSIFPSIASSLFLLNINKLFKYYTC